MAPALWARSTVDGVDISRVLLRNVVARFPARMSPFVAMPCRCN